MLTKNQVEKIAVLRQEGKSPQEIADLYKCSKATILRWVQILRQKGYEVPAMKKGRVGLLDKKN